MLSGIMFPIELLPKTFEMVGKIFPASWGYKLMIDGGFQIENMWYLILVLGVAIIVCGFLLKKQKSN